MTVPTTARAHVLVAYGGTVVLKIAIAATSLHPASLAMPQSKLSLDAIRDLLRLTAPDEETGHSDCTSPRHDTGLPSVTSPAPSGEVIPMPESSDLSLMTDRIGKGWFSMLCHRSELIGSGMSYDL